MKKGKLPKFTKRLYDLHKDSGMSIVDFAKKIGTSRQSLGYYLNGERIPDAAMLKQIADRCNVSADFLLGISPVPSRDDSIQAISKATGLKAASIGFLKETTNLEILNCILNDPITAEQFDGILGEIKRAYIQNQYKKEHPEAPEKNNSMTIDVVDMHKMLAALFTVKITESVLDKDYRFDDLLRPQGVNDNGRD